MVKYTILLDKMVAILFQNNNYVLIFKYFNLKQLQAFFYY